ncbi:hypothetical protein COS61_01855 [Candidatus Wolfebacteria bacterium CG03_land_8_20_14_0_80_40_12]|uniref:HTH HARE-type domain-containing protein n=1 Tax=Candidatus Wolfebacteria bacterium CG03_land_8_20_14_0_80_40_12 TaxID=1975069 RepID=A0A2M7B5E5_9BACT|nr:MAG: hypothetical protein COS61_01855 [Candidatus Wolfebacteria bacterium CG03_land_8_20_14_0_80_40_12]
MLSATIDNLISGLKPRQQEVLANRFGLKSGEKKTLASIGEKYDLTRERIRQIEEGALKTVQNNLLVEKKEAIEEILKSISGHLGNFGGLRKEDLFLFEIKHFLKDEKLHHWHLKFLSEVAGSPIYYPTDHNFHAFWYLDAKHIQFADQFVLRFENLIADKKEEIVSGRFYDYFIEATKNSRLPHSIGLNYLSVSKKFGVNPFGDLGLSRWEEITPKTTRSKIYLILKKHSAPLHFKDITGAINRAGFNRGKAIFQTVHNELIKDPQFILVGRGIYGLKERGFIAGTAKNIISRILKEKGPLSLQEIFDLVSKQRFLKENTIILNLQNKKYFKKLKDGRYHIK